MENHCSANFMCNRTPCQTRCLQPCEGSSTASVRGVYNFCCSSHTYPSTCSPGSPPQDIKGQGPNPSFTWPTTGTSTALNVERSSTMLANLKTNRAQVPILLRTQVHQVDTEPHCQRSGAELDLEYCAGASGWPSEAGVGALELDTVGEPGEQVIGYV